MPSSNNQRIEISCQGPRAEKTYHQRRTYTQQTKQDNRVLTEAVKSCMDTEDYLFVPIMARRRSRSHVLWCVTEGDGWDVVQYDTDTGTGLRTRHAVNSTIGIQSCCMGNGTKMLVLRQRKVGSSSRIRYAYTWYVVTLRNWYCS